MRQVHTLPFRNIWGGTFAIREGKTLQETWGEKLVALYREQTSYVAVAYRLHLDAQYGPRVKPTTLGALVRSALVGNTNARLGPVYPGLLDHATLASLALQHHLTDDTRDRTEGRGIYSIPPEKKRTQLLTGLKTQGKTLWTPAEVTYLVTHCTDPALHSPRGVDTQKLVAGLNETCHVSDGIRRTARQVSRALYRFRLKALSSPIIQ